MKDAYLRERKLEYVANKASEHAAKDYPRALEYVRVFNEKTALFEAMSSDEKYSYNLLICEDNSLNSKPNSRMRRNEIYQLLKAFPAKPTVLQNWMKEAAQYPSLDEYIFFKKSKAIADFLNELK